MKIKQFIFLIVVLCQTNVFSQLLRCTENQPDGIDNFINTMTFAGNQGNPTISGETWTLNQGRAIENSIALEFPFSISFRLDFSDQNDKDYIYNIFKLESGTEFQDDYQMIQLVVEDGELEFIVKKGDNTSGFQYQIDISDFGIIRSGLLHYQFVVGQDSSIRKFYLETVYQKGWKGTTEVGTLTNGNFKLTLGNFQGTIQELRIYNEEVSAQVRGCLAGVDIDELTHVCKGICDISFFEEQLIDEYCQEASENAGSKLLVECGSQSEDKNIVIKQNDADNFEYHVKEIEITENSFYIDLSEFTQCLVFENLVIEESTLNGQDRVKITFTDVGDVSNPTIIYVYGTGITASKINNPIYYVFPNCDQGYSSDGCSPTSQVTSYGYGQNSKDQYNKGFIDYTLGAPLSVGYWTVVTKTFTSYMEVVQFYSKEFKFTAKFLGNNDNGYKIQLETFYKSKLYDNFLYEKQHDFSTMTNLFFTFNSQSPFQIKMYINGRYEALFNSNLPVKIQNNITVFSVKHFNGDRAGLKVYNKIPNVAQIQCIAEKDDSFTGNEGIMSFNILALLLLLTCYFGLNQI